MKLKKEIVAFDTETTGLRPYNGDAPFLVSIGDASGYCRTWRWDVKPYSRKVTFRAADVEEIRVILEDPSITKVGHNISFDIRMLELNCGIKTRGALHDTMFMAHVFNTIEPSFGLKELARKYLRMSNRDETILKQRVTKLRRVAKKKGWKLGSVVEEDYWLPWALEGTDEAREYCAEDVRRTLLLYFMYTDAFAHDALARHTYQREMQLWPVTYAMEARGVRVDPVELEKQIVLYRGFRHEAASRLRGMAPHVNINSPKQLAEYMFRARELQVVRETPNGAPSVGRETMEFYHGKDDFVDALIKFRAAEKALGSFFMKFKSVLVPDHIVHGTTVLHPDFRQLGPATGRYSCRNPNLQNVADALGSRASIEPIQARSSFGPRPGYAWDHYDYTQLEIIIFADISKEPTLTETIIGGGDLHTAAANKAWGGVGNEQGYGYALVALEWDKPTTSNDLVKRLREELGWPKRRRLDAAREVFDERFNGDIVALERSLEKKNVRNRAKLILFVKIFGGGINAAQDILKSTYEEASQFLADYDAAMPRIVEFIKETTAAVRRDGYVLTNFGRRLYVNTEKAYRGVNYRVQGSAADLLKTKMYQVNKFLRSHKLDCHIVMTIHDELVIERSLKYSADETLWIMKSIKGIMESTQPWFDLAFHVAVDTTTKNWISKEHVNVNARVNTVTESEKA